MKSIWTGRVMSALGVLFLTMDAVMKLLGVPQAIDETCVRDRRVLPLTQ